jgi:hypothetical protein
MTVTRDGSHYLTQLTDQRPVQVFPDSPTSFFTDLVHAQISFVRDGKGDVTALILHQGGFDITLPRIDKAEADAIEAAERQHIASGKPLPGTEASVRDFFQMLETNQPNYDRQVAPMAVAMRQNWSSKVAMIKQLGALQSVSFRSVNPGGYDVYEVVFANGKVQCGVAPLTDDGKVSGRFWRQDP